VNVCEGLAGRRKAWIGEFITASGFAAIAADVLDDETREMLGRELGDFTIPAIKSAVIKASREQLERALGDARTMVPFIAAFTEMLARGANEPGALLLDAKTELDAELHVVQWTALALWARERGVDLDGATSMASQYAGGLAAIVELARMFSWARGPLFGPNGEAELAKLHDYEQKSVAERVRKWVAEKPGRAEAISSLAS
jgi:hypothetical protein